MTTIRDTVVLGVILLLGSASPAPGQHFEGGAPRVAAIRFEGVSALSRAQVRDAVVSRDSRCRSLLLAPVCAVRAAGWAVETAVLDTTEVRRDQERIRTLYAAWGYPVAAVTSRVVNRSPGVVEVHFLVEEGEPIGVRSVRVVGLDALAEPIRIPDPLPLRPGAPFAPLRVEATARQIEAALAEQGHAYAGVEAFGTDDGTGGAVDVVVEVSPGPVAVFGRTAVLPGPPLSIRDVERRLAYRPGERFRPSALEHTAERLYRLPVVQRVFIDPLPAAGGDPVVVTTIGVTPGRVQGLQFGGVFSSSSCLEGSLGWGHRYALGSPRVVTVRGAASNLLGSALRSFPCTGVGDAEFAEVDYAATVELQEPVGADTWLLLGGEFSRVSSPQAFIRRGLQVRLGVRHALSRTVDGTVVYTPERRDQLAAGPVFCAVHGVCAEERISAFARRATLAPLQLSLAWTPPLVRRPPAPPPPGPAWMHPPLPRWLLTGRVTGSGAGALTGSEFSFGSLVAEGTAVVGRGRSAEGAARVRVGTLLGVDGPLPPHVRLFGGGPLGVRGVATNLLGPLVLTATPAQVVEIGCEPAPGGCQDVVADPRLLRVRPTGGEQLAELSVEARRWVHAQIQLAGFVDVGWIRSGAVPGAPGAVAPSEALWAPGIGALGLTPFGPVRVDVAYNPSRPRRYPLLMRTQELGEQTVLGDVWYDPFGFGEPAPLRELWRRLQFQLSMGLPF